MWRARRSVPVSALTYFQRSYPGHAASVAGGAGRRCNQTADPGHGPDRPAVQWHRRPSQRKAVRCLRSTRAGRLQRASVLTAHRAPTAGTVRGGFWPHRMQRRNRVCVVLRGSRPAGVRQDTPQVSYGSWWIFLSRERGGLFTGAQPEIRRRATVIPVKTTYPMKSGMSSGRVSHRQRQISGFRWPSITSRPPVFSSTRPSR